MDYITRAMWLLFNEEPLCRRFFPKSNGSMEIRLPTPMFFVMGEPRTHEPRTHIHNCGPLGISECFVLAEMNLACLFMFLKTAFAQYKFTDKEAELHVCLDTPFCVSTRAVVVAGIVALCACAPVHIASDSKVTELTTGPINYRKYGS